MTTAPPAWLALVLSLPTANATVRMRVWRSLKALGCAALRDGVYLLPESAAARAAFDELARSISDAAGSAEVMRLVSTDAAQEGRFRVLFDRGADYRMLLDDITAARARAAGTGKPLRALRRGFDAIAAVDFFPGPARDQARQALEDLESAQAGGEPRSAGGRIRRLDRRDYQARTWATRRHLWVDRMASAWLIRRFIDRRAKFLWLGRPEDCPKRALGFDFDGAAFTHSGTRVTFEVLLASFGLEDDAALRRIAALVHYLDAGGIAPEAAAGVEAILCGARRRARDDDALLTDACRIFDSLYASQQEPTP